MQGWDFTTSRPASPSSSPPPALWHFPRSPALPGRPAVRAWNGRRWPHSLAPACRGIASPSPRLAGVAASSSPTRTDRPGPAGTIPSRQEGARGARECGRAAGGENAKPRSKGVGQRGADRGGGDGGGQPGAIRLHGTATKTAVRRLGCGQSGHRRADGSPILTRRNQGHGRRTGLNPAAPPICQARARRAPPRHRPCVPQRPRGWQGRTNQQPQGQGTGAFLARISGRSPRRGATPLEAKQAKGGPCRTAFLPLSCRRQGPQPPGSTGDGGQRR